ncbi:hypothetical protein [Aporhodopirellula aestuarii]|uniref:Uncharacterized protein n=1 Tax=Aporhodopirellula aestuarii TaxID=2950107 RepID=A0ABT0U616_9BACT|nr:hypothetical protein [Aporhodopirellula aestuarii]MCM2372291.1 hypothetical protein [Aporhodopirellula aestuarii]
MSSMSPQPDEPDLDNDETDDYPDTHDEASFDDIITAPSANRVTNRVDKDQIAQFVTTIKNAEQQVGENIIMALQHEDTVAVLTTIAMGPDGNQRVISAALNPRRMKLVQEILQDAEQEREDEQPCFGFHCLVKPKNPDPSG